MSVFVVNRRPPTAQAMTVSVTLSPRTSRWLERRSGELGVTPEQIAADIIERKETSEEFLALSREVGTRAAERGLTDEVLTGLLDGETYE